MSAFLDTNVLVYWMDKNRHADQVEALLEQDCAISVQVLNEFAHVLRSKRGLSLEAITDISQTLQSTCSVCDLTVATHRLALQLARRYQLPMYDACIVAAAAQMHCETVYSEDMQHGLSVQIPPEFGGGSLSIRNPFL